MVLQPVALAVPQSWEARNSLTFWGLYAVETPVCLGIAFLVLFFSYTGQAAIRSARVLSAELAVQVRAACAARVTLSRAALGFYHLQNLTSARPQAAQTQALLEAAMPPAVARALLDDKPAADLTCSYPSATIAFVELDDFSDKVGGQRYLFKFFVLICWYSNPLQVGGSPTELLQWLDHVYVAFDALVDAYGERVNKIEVVSDHIGSR